MAVSRFYDPNPPQFSNAGVLAAGGTITFYELDESTLKNVFAEPALSTNLGSSVGLDSSGRLVSAVFIDGPYSAQLKLSNDAQVWLKGDLGETEAGAIQALDPADGEEGQFYGTDGVDAGWYDVRQVPDPTGSSGKYLGTDGEALTWTSFPAATVYDSTNLPGGITQGSTSFQIGKMLVQCGSGTIPSSGTLTSNVAVVFGTAYATLLHVDIQITGSGGSTPQGAKPGVSYVGSLTGFTAYAYAADEHDTPGWFLTSGTSFTYVAIGLVA